MNKKQRNYPWYKYNGIEVVLVDCTDNPNAEKFGIENCGNIYAVPISTAEREKFKLNYEDCKTTYQVSYAGTAYPDIDNGETIEIGTTINFENPEDTIECWGTIEDFIAD